MSLSRWVRDRVDELAALPEGYPGAIDGQTGPDRFGRETAWIAIVGDLETQTVGQDPIGRNQ